MPRRDRKHETRCWDLYKKDKKSYTCTYRPIRDAQWEVNANDRLCIVLHLIRASGWTIYLLLYQCIGTEIKENDLNKTESNIRVCDSMICLKLGARSHRSWLPCLVVSHPADRGAIGSPRWWPPGGRVEVAPDEKVPSRNSWYSPARRTWNTAGSRLRARKVRWNQGSINQPIGIKLWLKSTNHKVPVYIGKY